MRVDDLDCEALEYWCDRAAEAWLASKHAGFMVGDRMAGIQFQDDAPDPLNSQADTMAVISGLAVNLTCEYTPGRLLIAHQDAWTARVGMPGLTDIAIKGDTQAEAVAKLFVIMALGRHVPG